MLINICWAYKLINEEVNQMVLTFLLSFSVPWFCDYLGESTSCWQFPLPTSACLYPLLGESLYQILFGKASITRCLTQSKHTIKFVDLNWNGKGLLWKADSAVTLPRSHIPHWPYAQYSQTYAVFVFGNFAL